jgi:hypothetical protein
MGCTSGVIGLDDPLIRRFFDGFPRGCGLCSRSKLKRECAGCDVRSVRVEKIV